MSWLVQLFAASVLIEVHIQALPPGWKYALGDCNLVHEECGVDHWYEKYPACNQVGTQSPIDAKFAEGFTVARDTFLEDLTFLKAPCNKADLIVNRHGSKVTFPTCEATFTTSRAIFKRKPYNFVSFSFHSPSEHTVDGMNYPLEVQFVHKNPVDKSILIVAVFLRIAPDVTAASSFIADLQNQMPWWDTSPPASGASESVKTIQVDWPNEGAFSPYDFIPSLKEGYYTYEGSLTTPECNTSVQWILAPTTQSVSQQTLNRFRGGINIANPSRLALYSDIVPSIASPPWHPNAWVTPPTEIEWKTDLKVNTRALQEIGTRKFYKVTDNKATGYVEPNPSFLHGSSSLGSLASVSSGSGSLTAMLALMIGICMCGLCGILGFYIAMKREEKQEKNSWKHRQFGGMSDSYALSDTTSTDSE